MSSGDAPGFPVHLTDAGSYRLTGNLDVSQQTNPADVSAIVVTSSFVTLDLNGFSLVGPTLCTGSPISSCAPTGSGNGIDSSSANMVRIANGVVRGFGHYGIVAANASVERVQAFNNALTGVWLAFGGAISDSAASENGSDGFAGAGVLISSSRALANRLSGIYLYPGEARDCEAVGNGAIGIHVGAGLAHGNVARNNVGCAIDALSGGYARNAVYGTSTLCDGTELGQNLCNGSDVCP